MYDMQKELYDLIQEEPFNTFEMRKHSLKGRVMAMMLNGSLEWDKGCRIRDIIDTVGGSNG